MSILKLIYHPDPILSTPTKAVEAFDEKLKKMVDDLWQTYHAQERCSALAANQCGLPYAMTVIGALQEGQDPICLINPDIFESSDRMVNMREGCMSFPGVTISVSRPEWLKVRYQDIGGQEHVLEADGFFAKCIHHEIDHLQGITFLDRLSPLKRKMVEDKYFKRKKFKK